MKCPKCGQELISGVCLNCGHIQTYENLDDAFSQYTGYASQGQPLSTQEVPQTPPLEFSAGMEGLVQPNPAENPALALEANPFPAGPGVPDALRPGPAAEIETVSYGGSNSKIARRPGPESAAGSPAENPALTLEANPFPAGPGVPDALRPGPAAEIETVSYGGSNSKIARRPGPESAAGSPAENPALTLEANPFPADPDVPDALRPGPATEIGTVSPASSNSKTTRRPGPKPAAGSPAENPALALEANPFPADPDVPDALRLTAHPELDTVPSAEGPRPDSAPDPAAVSPTKDPPVPSDLDPAGLWSNPAPAENLPVLPENAALPEKAPAKPAAPGFTPICPKCGRPLRGRYCGGCGYDSGPRYETGGVRVCPVCGAKSRGAFCGRCGRDLRSQRPDSPETAVSPPAQRPPSPSGSLPPLRKKWVAAVLCLLGGFLGLHRMYVGKVGTGLLCMLLCGLYGMWPLVDLILILTGRFTDKEGRPLS